MEKVKVEIEVSKETYEMGQVIGNLLGSVGTAMEDGKFDMKTELPQVLMMALANIAPAIDKVEQIPVEFKEDPTLATQAMLVPISSGIGKLLAGLKKAKEAQATA